ncbi:hypothetical protein N431DRAFT_436829 [Stipitochalara longipes BDJ]|nr:hypothetical protein N431DRAFT_436829 [Stipitochalara longipes BDJ]
MRRLGGVEEDEGEEELRINARTLLDIDPFQLKTEDVDGRALEPAYMPPAFQGDLTNLQTRDEGMKTYTGGCHCGAVTIAVKSKPMPEVEVREDNCSICRRNGNASIYPTQSFVRIAGTENTTMYRFNKGWVGHPFCKICGVQVHMKVFGPEVKDSWSEEMSRMVKEKCQIVPVRVAVLEGLEWSELKVERSDEGTEGYVLGS